MASRGVVPKAFSLKNLLFDPKTGSINPVSMAKCECSNAFELAASIINMSSSVLRQGVRVSADHGTESEFRLSRIPTEVQTPTAEDIASRLGAEYGRGGNGIVYQDTLSDDYLIKVVDLRDNCWTEKSFRVEVECFNKYYGQGSATLIIADGKAYSHMKKIRGIPMNELSPAELQVATPLYMQAIDRILAAGITTWDTSPANFLYDKKENKVNPVDISCCEDMWELYKLANVTNKYTRGTGRMIRVNYKEGAPLSTAKFEWVDTNIEGTDSSPSRGFNPFGE